MATEFWGLTGLKGLTRNCMQGTAVYGWQSLVMVINARWHKKTNGVGPKVSRQSYELDGVLWYELRNHKQA